MIPLFRPSCGDEEIEAVTRVLRSGWWGQGPETEKFEAEFAAYTGAKFAVAVNSATMALELAARATGLTNGIVIVPALTFVSSAQAMQHAGNQVVFADVHEADLCIDWTDVYEKMCEFPDPAPGGGNWGVVPVWYGGAGTAAGIPRPIHDAFTVIEDCAHAAGSKFTGRRGIASAWSFHAVKNLAAGDGGMITTDDEEVAREARRLRWCGIDKSTWERDKDSRVGYGWDYDIPGDGFKAHMNDITAAIGRVQLRKLDERNSVRRAQAAVYNCDLSGLGLGWLKTPKVDMNSATHMYVVRVPAQRRPDFIRHMIANGVSAGVHYKPLNHYKALFPDADPSTTPVTERVWQTLVTLPLFPSMTQAEQEQVIAAVRSFRA
jgi:perosamine synthetase